MRNRRRIWGAIVLGALALGTAVFLVRSREPVYQGRSLSHWVNLYGGGPYITTEEEKALASLRLDTNAIPYLLKWIQYTPSDTRISGAIIKTLKWLDTGFGNMVEWMWYTPRFTRARGAQNAFVALGTEAATAIPELDRLLITPPDEEARSRAACALGFMGDLGLPVLVRALTNANPDVRYAAMFGLQHQGRNAWPAVPLLIEMMADPDRSVGAWAYSTLHAMGIKPNRIVDRVLHQFGDLFSGSPNGVMSRSEQLFSNVKINGRICRLQVVLDKSDPEVRHAIINALRSIAAEARTNGPPQEVKE